MSAQNSTGIQTLLDQSSGNKKAEEEANKEAEAALKEIDAAGKKSGKKVVDDLIKAVTTPRPEVSDKVLKVQSSSSAPEAEEKKPVKPQFTSLGNIITDDFANFKNHYDTPKHPIVLAHGLLGFDELRLAGKWFPGVQYWRGIREALEQKGIEVITTTVPTTGSIEERALVLHEQIKTKAPGKDVNIIAHSMGGLDSRYLISSIRPTEFKVLSLTTIATPHRGSSAADMLFRDIGADNVASLYRLLSRLKIDTGAFAQLTCEYVQDKFNPAVPDDRQVRYFSYGASATPHVLSIFRLSHDLMEVIEGPNDGLVSVRSSKWGGPQGYKGTLMGVTHLDLINWTNRFKRLAANAALIRPNFNAVAFYLAIVDMLAKEGF
ncbi:hypothetical protein DV737_g4492, partial [Chaetothyriales sp. CBS 132003]